MSKNKFRNDVILIAVLLLCTAAGLFLFNALKAEGDVAVLIIDGEESARYPLDADTEVVIETEAGKNILVIRDGVAYVREADCPDGICSAHRPVSMVGETIVCLPHSLVIRIEAAGSEPPIDIAI